MAGQAERHAAGAKDDFWSWREAMYRCALGIDPEQLEGIAAMLYAAMLRQGYTHVAEFHYLHHDKEGKPYDNLAEMGERLIAAAETAGIKITLIPVFYQRGGFAREALPQQRRFLSRTTDDYLQLLDDSASAVRHSILANLGFSVHSLRAVDQNDIIKTFRDGPPSIPFHLHAAEQKKEVADCLAILKQRPVAWILDHLPVTDRFNLVHCTHLDDVEVKSLAASGAHVVLCPGTEGNLGDGIFRLSDYTVHGGAWCIGTDSHISLSPIEDLRWLDYTQRLVTHKRNTFDDGAARLISSAVINGRCAMGLPSSGYFEVGTPLDAVVFDAHAPLLMQAEEQNILSAILYTSSSAEIFGTLVNGKWCVKNLHHVRQGAITLQFLNAVRPGKG